jgi:threonine dehydrogenase-like Zn-dependent dehydrogenase
MRQAILYGQGDLRFEERPIETEFLQPGMLHVETEVSALSTGTDLGNYLGNSTYVPGAPDYPRAVGYSNVGVIRKVGNGVKSLRPEQRVFSMKPHQSAFVAQQDELLLPVPQSVSSEEASLSYLTHLGLASLRQARFEPGENVVVIGLGVIGLCTIGLARAMGAKVIGIANSVCRAEAARSVGAHNALLNDDPNLEQKLEDTFGGIGPDIVVLTANQWEAYRLSVSIARYAGRVSVLGFPGRFQSKPDFNPLDPNWFYGKQLTLLGAGFAPQVDCPPEDLRFNLRRNLQYILELMADKSLRLESLITHRLPSIRMKEAYELAKRHDKSLIAAVFDWRIGQ